MKCFFNGVEAAQLSHIRGGDTTFAALFVNDDGSPVDLSAPGVATIEGFSSTTRTDTPAWTLAVTPGAGASAGFGTFQIQDDNTVITRATWYCWGKWASDSGTGVGTLVHIGTSPSTLTVK